jgi:hypothetical protein
MRQGQRHQPQVGGIEAHQRRTLGRLGHHRRAFAARRLHEGIDRLGRRARGDEAADELEDRFHG